jgi:hypothetical protein
MTNYVIEAATFAALLAAAVVILVLLRRRGSEEQFELVSGQRTAKDKGRSPAVWFKKSPAVWFVLWSILTIYFALPDRSPWWMHIIINVPMFGGCLYLLADWIRKVRVKKIIAAHTLPLHIPNDWKCRCAAALSSDGVKSWRDVPTGKLYLRQAVRTAAWILPVAVIVMWPLMTFLPRAARDYVLLAVMAVVLLLFMRAVSKQLLLIVQGGFGFDALQTIAGADRPPILYLRSFDLDSAAARGVPVMMQSRLSMEAMLATVLHRWGPVLAIGRPGEAEPMTGATRFYVDDAHWRQKIEELAPLCQFVIWATGYTEGLQWEIEHLVKTLPAERLLLWPHVHIGKSSKAERQAKWQRVLETYQKIFPKTLPEDIEHAYFLGFDRYWRPIAIPGPGYRKTWWDRIDLAGYFKMTGLTPYLIDHL